MDICPRCGAPMTDGLCDNCGFPINRIKMITWQGKKKTGDGSPKADRLRGYTGRKPASLH